MKINLLLGDCVARMSAMPEGSIGAIVSDPPYGLRFMNKEFDDLGDGAAQREWHRPWLTEAFRVLRPGGVIKAFGGTRTFHHLAATMRTVGFTDVGLEAWSYGSGFPKSLNIGKALDAHIRLGGSNPRRLRQTEHETGGDAYTLNGRNNGILGVAKVWDRKEWDPSTDAARTWNGWGTALKPSWEPVVVGRKPLS